jgi:hypothetical protein
MSTGIRDEWTRWILASQEERLTELHTVPISLEAMLGCAKRELALRRNVYRKWVRDKRYTQRQADHEIELMQAIVDHFNDQIAKAAGEEQ